MQVAKGMGKEMLRRLVCSAMVQSCASFILAFNRLNCNCPFAYLFPRAQMPCSW